MLYATQSGLNSDIKQIHRVSGFSLLKLLLVVALIGILAAFVVPSYQTYLQKTRFMEVVQHTHAIRVVQSACLLQAGNNVTACDTSGELAMSAPLASDNTQSIGVSATSGIITGTATAAAGGFTFTLSPSINSEGLLTYTEGGSCISAGFCKP